MLDNGFITIQRKILNWEWYSDTNVVRLFLHLLLKANWEDKKWQGIEIKRGQLVTSVKHLSQETKLTPKQIRNSLEKLKRTGEVAIKTANKYSLITIVNYDFYQTKEEERGKQEGEQTDNQRANKGQQLNNNNNKNKRTKEKEINKEKEPKLQFAEFVSMTNGEYDKLVATYGREFTNKCVTVLDNYKGANGKKYKSDYRAILNWVVDRVKQDTKKQGNTGNVFADIAREEGIL